MSARPSGWAVGWIMFAAIMMLLIGFFHVIAGLVAIVDDNFYVATKEYVFQFDRTTWGWIHLIFGIVVFLAGLSLFKGAIWARTVGVILGVISAVVGFAWLALVSDLGHLDRRHRGLGDLGTDRPWT